MKSCMCIRAPKPSSNTCGDEPSPEKQKLRGLKSRRQKSNPLYAPPASRPQSKRRLWIFRLTALLLPLGLLAALELALRLAGYGYDAGFFHRLRIGNKDYFVQNDDFSLQFFPKETTRTPGPIRMPVHKAPGTFRIFIFGESAAMGDPEPAYGAGRYLEMLLREKYPGTNFEIVNTAFTAISSHVIVPVARECAKHDGDLWIVYMGNNEMVGPFGAATVFGRQAPSVAYVRLATAIQRTRTGQLITELSRKLGHGARSTSWAGMEMFLQNQIAPDSPLKETVYRNFQKNLDDIVRAGLGSGAKILLNTVAVNLKDCPPFASLLNSNLPPAGRAQFDASYAEAGRQEGQSNFATAAQLFEQAAKLEAQNAGLQFRWARCLLAQTNFAAAREHFQSACDDDALPFRADSRINAAIRDERKGISDDNLILFDAAAALASNNPSNLCGEETFYEHVHFNFDGNYRLALAWAEQIEPLLLRNTNAWASQAVCEQMLGLSDWNRALILELMTGRMQQPPFSSQPNNIRRMDNLQERIRQLHGRMNAEDAATARENFLKQLERAPEDYLLRENFALFLQATGNLPQAVSEWRRVHDLIPQDFLADYQIGRMLGGPGQWSEAESSLRQAVKMRPSLTEGWIELGNVLASQDKLAEAIASYSTALKQRPQDAQTVFRMGKVLAKLNRHAEAMENYRTAIKLNPADWEPHYELGGELDSAGRLDEAGNEFAAAAKLNPDYSRAHFNYGVLLAKQGRYDDAQREFAETIRLEPGYSKAREYLAELQAMKTRAVPVLHLPESP
jgi:tetratricopeptide (TPR) repeat protein